MILALQISVCVYTYMLSVISVYFHVTFLDRLKKKTIILFGIYIFIQ